MTNEFTITLPGDIELFCRETGNGSQPVLFVPGWTMTAEVFERQFAFFESSADYRFISFDPRSHGRSSKVAEGNHYEQHGRDLMYLIESLDLWNIVIAGWSFGTLAVLSCLHQFGSDRLSGLIMLDGPPRAAGADNENDWVTYRYDDQDGSQAFYTMGKLRDPETSDIEFARWMLRDKTPETVEWVVSMTRQTPVEAAALLNATAVFLDYRQNLVAAGSRMPIWCIVRESETEIVRNWCEQYLPAALVTGFGEHMMFWEDAGKFNHCLSEFLSRCRIQ